MELVPLRRGFRADTAIGEGDLRLVFGREAV